MPQGQKDSYDNIIKFATSDFTFDYFADGSTWRLGWRISGYACQCSFSTEYITDRHGDRPTLEDGILTFNEGHDDEDTINLNRAGPGGGFDTPKFQHDLIFKVWVIDEYELTANPDGIV